MLTVEPLTKRGFAVFYSAPLNMGKSGAARIGGGERSEPISRIVFMTYDTESKSRNADFISIAQRAIHYHQPVRAVAP